MDPLMKSLQNRAIWYNLLQTSSLLIIVGNFYYRWKNFDAWNETSYNVINCEANKTWQNETDYDTCVTEFSDQPHPNPVAYWLFSFSGMIGVTGAVIFQCS